MKRLESNQTEQSCFFCPPHFTGVNCWRQDFRIVPFSYLLRMYDSIHLDQVYRKRYIRNIVKILLSRGRHVHLKTCKQKKNSVDEIADASGDFPWDFNRPLLCKGLEYQRLFLFQFNSASGNGLQFKSIYRKSLEIFPPTAQPSTKTTKKVSFFQTLKLNKVKWAHKRQRLLWMLTFTWGRQINRCHVLNAMWTTSLTCAEVASFVRTLPVVVHSARHLGCLRSLISI